MGRTGGICQVGSARPGRRSAPDYATGFTFLVNGRATGTPQCVMRTAQCARNGADFKGWHDGCFIGTGGGGPRFRNTTHGKICLHHRRRRELPRQRGDERVARAAPEEPRLPRLHAEARPLPQRRSRHDVALPARRGVRDGRRRGDGPRPRPLRALRRRHLHEGEQLHLRPHLLGRPRPRARRRLPRRDGPGRAARHGRDQGRDPLGRRGARRRARAGHRPVRDRRRLGRHREPAVPRGRAPVPLRGRRREHLLRPPHARALPQGRRRAQDQALAALGRTAPRDRHHPRHPRLPHRARDPARVPRQARALLQRAARVRDRGEGRGGVCLRRSARAARAGARRAGPAPAPARHLAHPPHRLGHARAQGHAAEARLPHRPRRQVRRRARRLQVRPRGPPARRDGPRRPRRGRPDRGGDAGRTRPCGVRRAPRARLLRRRPRPGRLRLARRGGQD